jgi:predicted RNA binding protein YcfA (HicA-like mRNA interferase family)
MGQVTRRQMETWLLQHGFTLLPGGKTGHKQYRGPSGVKVSLPGHGPQDLTKKHVALIVRHLVSAGFDRDATLREIRAS